MKKIKKFLYFVGHWWAGFVLAGIIIFLIVHDYRNSTPIDDPVVITVTISDVQRQVFGNDLDDFWADNQAGFVENTLEKFSMPDGNEYQSFVIPDGMFNVKILQKLYNFPSLWGHFEIEVEVCLDLHSDFGMPVLCDVREVIYPPPPKS